MMSVSFIAVSMIIGLICGLGIAFAGDVKLLALAALAGELRQATELPEVTIWFAIAAVALGFVLPLLMRARSRMSRS